MDRNVKRVPFVRCSRTRTLVGQQDGTRSMPSRIARPTARARYYDTPDGTVITPCVTTAIRDSDFAPPVFFYTPAKDPRNEFNNNVYGRVKHGRVIIIIAAVLRTTTVYSRRPPPPGHGTYALVVLDAGHAVLICLEIRLLRTLHGVFRIFVTFRRYVYNAAPVCLLNPHPLSLQWTRARARVNQFMGRARYRLARKTIRFAGRSRVFVRTHFATTTT